jgi:Type II secretion system (T2SS), protein E, N-terminal domain
MYKAYGIFSASATQITLYERRRKDMYNAVRQSIGQQEGRDSSYHVVKHAQDIVIIMRQTLAAQSTQCSQYALVIITLHFAATKTSTHVHSMTPEHTTRQILSTIRRRIRRSDLVWLKDTTYYFLLPEANLQGGNIVQNRLWKVLQETILKLGENAIDIFHAMTIGCSAYPNPSRTLEECISDAQVAQMRFELSCNDNIELSQAEPDLSMRARQLGVPYLPFLPRTFPNKIKRLFRLELARELRCFPLGCTHNTITVAMSDPHDSQLLDRLQRETGMRIFPVLIHPDELENALEHINI